MKWMNIKKKITIGDRQNPLKRYVLSADIAPCRFIKQPAAIGEENLICEQKMELVAKDGKAKIGKMAAYIWFLPSSLLVPEADVRLATSPRQQAINYLVGLVSERREIEAKNLKYDSAQLISAITAHLHVMELYVEKEYRNRGIATYMFDFAQALSDAQTISLYSTPYVMQHTTTGYALSRLGFRERMTTVASIHHPTAKKTLYIHSVGMPVVYKPEKEKKQRVKAKKARANKSV